MDNGMGRRWAGPLLLAGVVGCYGEQDTMVEHIKHDHKTDEFILGRSVVSTFNNRNVVAGVEGPYVPDVDRLSGQHTVVRGGGRLLLNLCSQPDPDTVTREEFYQLGIINAPSAVNLNYNVEPVTSAIIPVDHDSLGMLTAFVNFDNVGRFYREVLGDTSRATSTRATVVYYGEIGLGCDLGTGGRLPILSIPLGATDNAVFVSTADVFIVLRDNLLPTGLELGNNPGVAAHEYGHRIFQSNVYADDRTFRLLAIDLLGSSTQKEALCTDDTPADELDDCTATPILQKGMDEGTADILAYTFTGEPDFFFERSLPTDSLVGGDESLLRDLSRDAVLDQDIAIYFDEVVNAAAKNELQFYRLGTLWSRGWYRSIINADTGAPVATEDERRRWATARYAPAVLRALRRLGQDFINPGNGLEYNIRFDPRQLIRRWIDEVSRNADGTFNNAVHSAACQQMCNRFGLTAYDAPLNGANEECPGFIGTNPAFENLITGTAFPCLL
jgi:hypothetical protein